LLSLFIFVIDKYYYILIDGNYCYNMSQPLNTRVEMELSRKDFRSIFLFKFRLGDTVAHTAVELCEAFGPSCVSIKTVQRWFKNFRSGDFNLEDARRAGKPNEIDQDLINSEWRTIPRLAV